MIKSCLECEYCDIYYKKVGNPKGYEPMEFIKEYYCKKWTYPSEQFISGSIMFIPSNCPLGLSRKQQEDEWKRMQYMEDYIVDLKENGYFLRVDNEGRVFGKKVVLKELEPVKLPSGLWFEWDIPGLTETIETVLGRVNRDEIGVIEELLRKIGNIEIG